MSRFGLVEDDDVEMMIESSKKGMHRTLEGQMVKVGSPECRADLIRRMDDMGYHRDDQSYGSDARSYFSGVLKVLRRKLRENDKIAESESQVQEEMLEESYKAETKRLDERAADRMLKLAGLID
jgi:hypothetical protein